MLAHPPSFGSLIFRLFVPLGLIVALLGAIITGMMYTVEAAASGAIAAAFTRWRAGSSRSAVWLRRYKA